MDETKVVSIKYNMKEFSSTLTSKSKVCFYHNSFFFFVENNIKV